MKRILALAAALLMLLSTLLCAPRFTVQAEEDRDIVITDAYLVGYRAAVAGHTPGDTHYLEPAEGEHFIVVYDYWYDNTNDAPMYNEDVLFVLGNSYSTGAMLFPDEGYRFADDVTFYINGTTELVDPEWTFHHPTFELDWFVQGIGLPCVPYDRVPGDVNGDGEVQVTDALMALRGAIGVVELTDEEIFAADMDGDELINVVDALTIMRIALGIGE